jgi:hypothetical protein
MASRQGPSIKVEGSWRRASFYRVSLNHCRRIKGACFFCIWWVRLKKEVG